MVAFRRTDKRARVLALAAMAWLALGDAAFAQDRQPVAAELAATMEAGFARLVFTFPEEIETETQLANNVLVVKFARPVRVDMSGLRAQLDNVVQITRADPDGSAVRIALSHKVSINTMEAGEKLFVDILPESWVGMPPGLPQAVVDDLAKRARDAERAAKQQQAMPEKQWMPVKLRFADAPTFSRFAFALAEPVPVTTEQDGQELRIKFAAPVRVELGEVRAMLPASVASIDVDYADGTATARIVLAPNAKARHFREESAFVVDVTPAPAVKPEPVQGVVPPAVQQMQTAQNVQTPPSAPQAPAKPESTATPMPPVVAMEDVKPRVEPPAGTLDIDTVFAKLTSSNAGVSLAFPFNEGVAAAMFRRGAWIWIVFDTARAININELLDDNRRIFSEATVVDIPNAKAVRLKLMRTWLASVETNGQHWTMHFGDAVLTPSQPLNARRITEENGPILAIPVEAAAAGRVHRIGDPEIGDEIRVITAAAPARGVLRAQDFVELKLLASAHGIALVPFADDLDVTLKSDFALIGRPKGLAVSAPPRLAEVRPPRSATSPLDAAIWESEKNRRYRERESEIANASANAAPGQRLDARMTLATFYLAHGLAAEAKGTLETVVREDGKQPVNARFYLLRGLSELLLARPERALGDLSNAELGGSHDAALLRAVAYAELSNWSETREHFRVGLAGLKLLPVDLQRRVLFAVLRAAVEVRDFAEAGRLLTEIEAVEIPKEYAAQFAVLSGRLAQGLGRIDRAQGHFETAARTNDGAAAAEARFKQIELRFTRGEISRAKAIDRLESQTFGWRGDRVELESSRLLARLYVGEARYREAFRLLDSALLSQSDAPVTRTFHNEMAAVFEDLFLSGKADALPPIEALALYYDFSKLTPIGRRGDELIRRLSDRLVSVDLLDQATELLQHQVEFRLTGAAKAQVATRLAIVHLLNRKPQRAVAILAGTRLAELPQDLREQRLLLESRGLMETKRFDQALAVIQNMEGAEAERQRADIQWDAKRWRLAGEAIERMLGERWKESEALTEVERHDVLRAGLAYVLANETIGLARLREKYAAKLDGGPERAAFDQIAENPNPRAIGGAAKILSGLDSLGVFLKLYQAKFPNAPFAERQGPERLTAR